MNKEQLIELGLTEDQAKTVMALHGKTVTTHNKEVEALKSQLSDLNENIAKRDKDLAQLKKDNGDNEEIRTQLEKLQEQNKALRKESAEKLAKIQKENAIDLALVESQVRSENAKKAVRTLLDMDIIKVEDDQVVGLKEQIEKIKESDPYFFQEEKSPKIPKPQKGDNIPKGSIETIGTSDGMTIDEYLATQLD